MRSFVPLALLLTGCLAGATNVALSSDETPRHTALPPAPPPSQPAVQFARRHRDGARYRRQTSAWIGLAGIGRGMRIHLGGDVAVTAVPGGYRERAEVREADAEGAAVYMDPRAGTPGMVGTRIDSGFDHYNAPIGEPEVHDSHGDPLIAEVARVVFGRLRIPFPTHEVRTGDRWDGETVTMYTQGAGGWVTLTLQPRFRLERVESGFAVISWTGQVHTQPFCELGPCLVGSGRVEGTSHLALSDGFTGRTELRYRIAVRGATAPEGAPAVLEIEARFTDRREPF